MRLNLAWKKIHAFVCLWKFSHPVFKSAPSPFGGGALFLGLFKWTSDNRRLTITARSWRNSNQRKRPTTATPPQVYEAVRDWACGEYGIDPSKVVRPFYPGGDYERFDYSDGKVVVDNPPFSILSKICAFYRDRGIPFFLFAPNLTIFSSTSRNGAHMLVTDCAIEYANGAIVNTSFVTSFGDDLIRTAPDLTKLVDDAVKRVRRESKKHLPKYAYPPELLTVTRLNKVGNAGVDFRVKASDVAFTRALDSQRAVRKAIYGGGYLLSENKAVELKAAELKAAEDVTVWTLSDKEKQIIGKLG